MESAGRGREQARRGLNLGAEFVAHAKPDGYTIMIASDPALTMNMFVHDKLPFDPEAISRRSLHPHQRASAAGGARQSAGEFGEGVRRL